MKKAVFITIHVGFNFGSVLQTIATSRILQDHGCEPVCINYIPPRVTYKRYFADGTASIVKLLRRIAFFPIYYKADKNFYNYVKSHCNLSCKIFTTDDFQAKCPKADVYVTGSDQVWNIKHNEGIDGHYFFEGITGKKIALSSSIGMTNLPDDYRKYMQSKLSEYDAISVREKSAVNLLCSMGLNSTQLLDPTLLINKEQWKEYASKKLVDKPYLFVYFPYNVENEDTSFKTVRKIADRFKLQVITYSRDSRDCFKKDYIDKTITYANPGDILSLFIHADYVVTNSFHGTAFSINLNKQFWVYMPSKFSTRLVSILELCQLNGRKIEGIIEDAKIDEIIDYTQSNSILDIERTKAHNFLDKNL